MDFENQRMLKTMFNARQTHRLLKRELSTDSTVMKIIGRSPLDEDFALDLPSRMVLHKLI